MNKKELTEIKKFLYYVCNKAKKITLPGFKKLKMLSIKKMVAQLQRLMWIQKISLEV